MSVPKGDCFKLTGCPPSATGVVLMGARAVVAGGAAASAWGFEMSDRDPDLSCA